MPKLLNSYYLSINRNHFLDGKKTSPQMLMLKYFHRGENPVVDSKFFSKPHCVLQSNYKCIHVCHLTNHNHVMHDPQKMSSSTLSSNCISANYGQYLLNFVSVAMHTHRAFVCFKIGKVTLEQSALIHTCSTWEVKICTTSHRGSGTPHFRCCQRGISIGKCRSSKIINMMTYTSSILRPRDYSNM
jgi:hypothetical protein